VELSQFSAHGDRTELIRWLSGLSAPPKQTFLVHGELSVMQSFRATLDAQFHWPLTIPKYGETFELA
jgi:metallo-beta-lactamase family protein